MPFVFSDEIAKAAPSLRVTSATPVTNAAVPFAREPLRHERAFSWVAGFLVLVPLVILARAHYALRTRPSLLLIAGLMASVIAAICLRLARQRLQELPSARPFDD